MSTPPIPNLAAFLPTAAQLPPLLRERFDALHGTHDQQATECIAHYLQLRAAGAFTDAPDLDAITEADLHGIFTAFQASPGQPWNEFLASVMPRKLDTSDWLRSPNGAQRSQESDTTRAPNPPAGPESLYKKPRTKRSASMTAAEIDAFHAAGTFHDDLLEIFTGPDYNASPGMIESFLYSFETQRTLIPDAPEVIDLLPEEAEGVFAIHNFDFTNMETWDEYIARVTKIQKKFTNTNNPFLANWNTKTDDRPTPWLNDCNPLIAEQYKEKLNRVLDAASPVGSNLFDLIGIPPADAETVAHVLTGLEDRWRDLSKGIGESTDDNNETFRWSRALVMLAGLGFPALRAIAKKYEQAGESAWTHWAECSDVELREAVIEARKISCYPISLLRADFVDLQNVCGEASLSPSWIAASLLVHVHKHIRRSPTTNELVIAYKGAHGRFPFQAEGAHQTLGDTINVNLKKSICRVLQIRSIKGPNRIQLDSAIDAVLHLIHPVDFPLLKDLSTKPEFVVPKGVIIGAAHELRGDYKWCSPGLLVSGFASIDLVSGKVNPEAFITGPGTLGLNWPIEPMRESERVAFRSMLPPVVTPLRPSELLKLLVRNVNDLGHAEGYWALIDAAMLISLSRENLAGSAVGSLLGNEYPLLVIYPMGSTKETTTNQGKTNYGRIIGGALVPGLPVTHASKSASAPAQRATASPIEKFGTALYDEFQLPESHEHFLAQAGLQGLMTGGTGGPGRANENSSGLHLKFPMLMTMKVSAFPPDIRNRSIPSFLDVLDASNRCNSKELALIMSGRVSLLLRLSALLWIHKCGFVDMVKAAPLMPGTFRFDGHGTVAALLTKSKTTAEIDAYLAAAGIQCDAQQIAADDSGLSGDIGIHAGFDPAYFFADMKESNARMLAEKCNAEPVKGSDVLRHIVEDTIVDCDRRRQLSDILRKHNISEQIAVRKMFKAMDEGRMKHPDGFVMKRLNRTFRTLVNGVEVGKSRPAIVIDACEEMAPWWSELPG